MRYFAVVADTSYSGLFVGSTTSAKRKIMDFHSNQNNEYESRSPFHLSVNMLAAQCRRAREVKEPRRREPSEPFSCTVPVTVVSIRNSFIPLLLFSISSYGILRPSFSVSEHFLKVNCSVRMNRMVTVRTLPTQLYVWVLT